MLTEKQREANRRKNERRRRKRQAERGIISTWKAAACISALIDAGATFSEAWNILKEVAEEQNLTIRKDLRN